MIYQAIVVGAGPAGSAAAITLARAGISVLLLDRDSFPRDKTCGDLIGSQALQLTYRLGVPRESFTIFPPLRGFALHTANNQVKQPPPDAARGLEARVVPRIVFDTILVHQALRLGVTFRQLKVTAVLRHPGDPVLSVRGIAGDETITCSARILIGADGWNSLVARSIGPGFKNTAGPHSIGIATRAYVTRPAGNDGRIHFYFTHEIQPGYGWFFPIDSWHANVGLGMLITPDQRPDCAQMLRQRLTHLLHAPDSPARPLLDGVASITAIRTWPLALGWVPRRLVADGVLLAGDAAAFISPLTGAGIFNAMRSGILAAQVAAAALRAGDCSAAALATYERLCRRILQPRLRIEATAQRILAAPARLNLLGAMLRALPALDHLTTRIIFNLG
jgi:geranylgeranyl reductase family protein